MDKNEKQLKHYIHVDNGGYTFSYDQHNGTGLTLNVGFFGYSDTTVTLPQLNAKDMKELVFFLTKVVTLQEELEEKNS